MNNKFILPIVSIIIIYVIYKLYKTNEQFLSPGEYPLNVDKPLLHDSYNVKQNPILEKSSQNIYNSYPVFSSNSLKNNNIRYWDLPTNGRCTPPDFCMNMYEKTPQNIPEKPINPGFKNKRVNFYNYL